MGEREAGKQTSSYFLVKKSQIGFISNSNILKLTPRILLIQD